MAPAFADGIYGAGPMAFGLLMSAQGLGSLIAAGYIALHGTRLRNPWLLLISASLLQGIGNIGFSYTDSLGIGFLVITGLGLISMVFWNHSRHVDIASRTIKFAWSNNGIPDVNDGALSYWQYGFRSIR